MKKSIHSKPKPLGNTTTDKQTIDLFPDLVLEPKLSLSEIESYLNETRVLGEVPSRQTLINWLENGRLRGIKIDGLGWRVCKSSFRKLLEEFEAMAA